MLGEVEEEVQDSTSFAFFFLSRLPFSFLCAPEKTECRFLSAPGVGVGGAFDTVKLNSLGAPSLVLFAVPRDVALLVADVARLFLLLALAGNVAHLAAVVAGHLVRPMLAILGDVAGAVAAVTPVFSLLAVPGEVAYPVALIALLPDGRLVVHAATAAASAPASAPGSQSSAPASAATSSILEALAGKVSQLVALVALRRGTHAPPPPPRSALDSLPHSAPQLPPAAAAPPGSTA